MIDAPVIPDATPQQRRIVHAAAGITILLGLVFVFVRAPHPFGWEGIDHYHDLALRLARGESFPTTDVPWGYAYFLAFFYRMAGDRQWVPLVAQVLLNGLVPILLYRLVRETLDARTAVVAALLVSVLSFNTVYASTQSSDSVCTVIFLAGLAAFASAVRANDTRLFALSGLLAGLASQFRPNLILFPGVLAVVTVAMTPRSRKRIGELAVYLLLAGAVSVPWIVRNYRLTGELIPTSTHGGVQLWYGSLQTGPYLGSWAHNPRSLFEAAPFDYSSLPGRAIVVSASLQCDAPAGQVDLRFWTDRDARPQTAATTAAADAGHVAFTVPAQPNRTAVYYYFAAARAGGSTTFTPAGGPSDPFVFFVDDRHLDDLDRHGDLLDAYDLIRVLRQIGFGEAAADRRLDLTHDGTIDARDLEAIVRELLKYEYALPDGVPVIAGVTASADAIAVRFMDGSTFTVPRRWSGSITDVAATPGIAGRLCYTQRRMRSLGTPSGRVDICGTLEGVRVNDVFYLREPHTMRRYFALAWDNIRRAPGAFAAAAAYRAVRLFVIQGTSDASTTWQFDRSRRVYAFAGAASLAYALAAAAGLFVALRRRQHVWMLLTPVLYIPATISGVLTNMRYTITAQPLLLAFVAVALTAAWDLRSTPATSTRRSPDTPA